MNAGDTVWRVGIDEAGYGPNLGPLVLALTASRVPANATDLWALFSTSIRKKSRGKDPRLIVDDSKKVHQGTTGDALLERGILALASAARTTTATMSDLLDHRAVGESISELLNEAWYDPSHNLPIYNSAEVINTTTQMLVDLATTLGVTWGQLRFMVIPAPRFNGLLDVIDNKAEVELHGIKKLVATIRELPGDDPIMIALDRLGGRTSYQPLLEEIFAEGWVRTVQESADAADYQVYGLSREIQVHVQPKADGEHLQVAWASMAAKYLREVCMKQFNAYWQTLVPSLKPTAGYPQDAIRFWNDIEYIVLERRWNKNTIWRRK